MDLHDQLICLKKKKVVIKNNDKNEVKNVNYFMN